MDSMSRLRWASYRFLIFGIAVLVSFGLSVLPMVGNAMAADLELDDRSGCTGSQVTFTLSVNNAPNEVASLGVDIGFDQSVLQYVSADFTGTLLEGFDFKQVNVPSAGVLRLGGFEAGGDSIVAGANGALVKLTFNVIGEQDHPLPLSALKDDITGWTTKDGSFTHVCFAIEPSTVTTCEGASVAFTVVPEGVGIPPFTWRVNEEMVQTGDSRNFKYMFTEAGIYAIRVWDSSVPAQTAEATATVVAEDDSGALDIEGARGSSGETVTIGIRIQEAPNQVAALGFDVTYDLAILTYNAYSRGDLITDFDFFNVNPVEPGRLRVGGFEAGADKIPQGASGSLVELTFSVNPALDPEECICSFVEPEDLKDDIGGWTASMGNFLANCGCNGDVNGDGEITPMDALCAFEAYLLICPTSCGIPCDEVCGDVTRDGEITPADALCIFEKYLMLPSCLD
jgi:hypothetical protein